MQQAEVRRPSRLAQMTRALSTFLVRSRGTEAKASAVAPLIAFDGNRNPVWAPRDYATFAREGLMQNPVAFRAVRMIAEAAASVPLLLYDRDQEIEDHWLLDVIARPAPGQISVDLLEALFSSLLVAGNAYVEAVATADGIRELHVLRADRVQVIPGADGWSEAYAYAAGGQTIRLGGEVTPGTQRILHLRFYHPLNDHYGLSPIEAAATAIDIHNEAARWNKALLDNSARPSGALVYGASEAMSPSQFERLKKELEENFQGARNAGRPLLLEGGLDWKSMSFSPRDMDFIALKQMAAREIALALGVPPLLLGLPGDNTYANYQEANRTFWRQTVIPLATRVAKALSAWLGQGLELRCDLDALDALAPDREALWARLDGAGFLTQDEKRAAAGYGPVGAAGAKFNPHHDAAGWFTFGPGGGAAPDGTPVDPASRRRAGPPASPAQEMRLSVVSRDAREAVRRTQELDPNWRPPAGLYETVEGEIRHNEDVAAAARARYNEITRDAIPGTNPSWGVNRLTKELYERGYRLKESTRAPGLFYENAETLEQVRIMERPTREFRNDSPQKHYNDYYYRYRSSKNSPFGSHITIPSKD